MTTEGGSRYSYAPLVFKDEYFCCDEAERFSGWVDTLLSRLTKDGEREPTTEQMYEAKAKLLDEYRKERNGALREHRDVVANANSEPCLYGVFLAAMERLGDITIQPTIAPPPVRRKAPPPVEERPRPKSTYEALEDLFGSS